MSRTQLFQRYSQRENVVTNNVLLLLQRLADERPRKFESLLASLVERSRSPGPDLLVGPRFAQQVRGPERVADGLVTQSGFDVLIETKLSSEFDINQAIRHLAQLRRSHNALLLLLGVAPDPQHAGLKRVFAEADAASPRVRVIVCGFKDLIDECRALTGMHDEELSELLDDFEAFCIDSSLLPLDDQTLFVPPCGQSFNDNLHWKLYYCPATRPHRAAKWLGIYMEKRVHAVGRIEHIVDVQADGAGNVDTGAASDEERQRILGAIASARVRGWDLLEEAHAFYVCQSLVATEFDKDSKGGIPGHRYFDLGRLRTSRTEVLTAEIIAQRLQGRRWSEWDRS